MENTVLKKSILLQNTRISITFSCILTIAELELPQRQKSRSIINPQLYLWRLELDSPLAFAELALERLLL
jgi:hypothetical protein